MKKLNFNNNFLDKFMPQNWFEMTNYERENTINELFIQTTSQLGIKGQYDIKYEEQENGIAAYFNEDSKPPYISLDKNYVLYGMSIPNDRNNEEEIMEYVQSQLIDNNVNIIHPTTLFNNCIHEIEHIRQYEVEKDIITGYDDYDTRNIKHNSTKLNVKIGFFNKNGIAFIPPSKIFNGMSLNTEENLFYKGQYVERMAYDFADYNSKQLLNYFKQNNLYVFNALNSLNRLFSKDEITNMLVNEYKCDKKNPLAELDNCICALSEKDKPNSSTKLWNKIKELSIDSYNATYKNKSALLHNNKNKDIEYSNGDVFSLNEMKDSINNIPKEILSTTQNVFEYKSIENNAFKTENKLEPQDIDDLEL